MIKISRILTIGLLAVSAHAQQSFIQTGESTLLPFEATIAILQSSALVTDIQLMTSASAQGRGVAGREVLFDQLVALHADISQGQIRKIADVRQVALRELFYEIESDEELLKKIEAEVKHGSRLEKFFTVVAASLLKK